MLIEFFSKRKLILFALVCCTGLVCFSAGHPKTPAAHDNLKQAGEKPGTYWELTTPEEQGIDSQKLLEMLQKVKKEKYNSHSIIIIRNHRLVLETYICPYTRDIPQNTRSASKSMVSALVGIALREKWIDSLDRTVYSYLPQYFKNQADPRKKKITLRHLVTMASGLRIEDQSSQTGGGPILSSSNPVKMTLESPMSENPGERFNYLTPLLNVMSLILTKTTGKNLKKLADTYLFAPLGIKDVQWKRDRMGNYISDAVLTPLEMAKFGVMFLDKGKWEGKQVVPEDWVEESTKIQISPPDTEWDGQKYGYWWWRSPSQNIYMALGWGGQGIFVFPDWNMVIVTTGSNLGGALSVVFNLIIPAVKSSRPLPANPKAAAALRQISRQLQFPSAADAEPIPPHPKIIKNINRKTYCFEPNNMGLIEMTFHFRDKACYLSVVHERGTFKRMEVGLDGIYRVSKARPWGEWPIHNKTALRGKWKNNNTFFLDLLPVGRGINPLMDIQFQGEEIDISVALTGTYNKFRLKGKRKKGK